MTVADLVALTEVGSLLKECLQQNFNIFPSYFNIFVQNVCLIFEIFFCMRPAGLPHGEPCGVVLLLFLLLGNGFSALQCRKLYLYLYFRRHNVCVEYKGDGEWSW